MANPTMHIAANKNRPRVFFDGGCPLCMREIAHYRRLDSSRALVWIDITREPEQLEAHGMSLSLAMSYFHVLDSSGIWRRGAWGFHEIWSHLPYYRQLARLLSLLKLLPLLDRAYALFARRRLRSRCERGSCGMRGGIRG